MKSQWKTCRRGVGRLATSLQIAALASTLVGVPIVLAADRAENEMGGEGSPCFRSEMGRGLERPDGCGELHRGEG